MRAIVNKEEKNKQNRTKQHTKHFLIHSQAEKKNENGNGRKENIV